MSKFSKLPAGIYYLPSQSGMTYLVRFMLGGARVSLGSHGSLEAAINAMMKFKMDDLKKQQAQMLAACGVAGKINTDVLESVKEELTSAESAALESYRELLESVPPHELSFDSEAVIGNVIIPQRIVVAFLHERFGE